MDATTLEARGGQATSAREALTPRASKRRTPKSGGHRYSHLPCPRPAQTRGCMPRHQQARVLLVPALGPDDASARPGPPLRSGRVLITRLSASRHFRGASFRPLRHNTRGDQILAPMIAPMPSPPLPAAAISAAIPKAPHRGSQPPPARTQHVRARPPLDRNDRLDFLSLLADLCSPGAAGDHGYIGFGLPGNPQFPDITPTIIGETGQWVGATGSPSGKVKVADGVAITTLRGVLPDLHRSPAGSSGNADHHD